MTPEERFTKIENAIESLIERQAHHDQQIDKLIQGQASNDRQIEKLNGAVRDLAAVSRTLIDAQQTTNTHIQGLAQAMQATDERLDRLAETVDRFLKGLQRPNGREGH